MLCQKDYGVMINMNYWTNGAEDQLHRLKLNIVLFLSKFYIFLTSMQAESLRATGTNPEELFWDSFSWVKDRSLFHNSSPFSWLITKPRGKSATNPPSRGNSVCTMSRKTKSTCRISGDSVLDEARELLLESVLVLFLQVAHVLWHVDAHDVLAVDLCVELLALWIIPREALGAEGGIQIKQCAHPRKICKHLYDFS